jgi:NDP-sugar pyrophosphorylase family protein
MPFVTTAVAPVAGLGTRLLPATKSQPKEMLPVAGKPVVEELAAAGVERIVFVTGRGKGAIEDHFDATRCSRPRRTPCDDELLQRLAFEQMGVSFSWDVRSSIFDLDPRHTRCGASGRPQRDMSRLRDRRHR